MPQPWKKSLNVLAWMLIVSTRKIDGQIEIVATNDDPNPALKLELTRTAVNFSDIQETKMTDHLVQQKSKEKHRSGAESSKYSR